MKGLDSQRELLKWNNLSRWRRSLELVACLDSNLFIGAVRLLVVSLIARIKHAVGAAIAGGSGCCFFRPFFLHALLRGAFSPVVRARLLWYVDHRWRCAGGLFFRRRAVHWPIYILEQVLYTPDYTNQPALFLYTHVWRRPRTPYVKCSDGPSCSFFFSFSFVAVEILMGRPPVQFWTCAWWECCNSCITQCLCTSLYNAVTTIQLA